MQTTEILELLGFMAPITSGMLCFTLLIAYRLFRKDTPMSVAQLRVMMLYYVSMVVGWINYALYRFSPESYVYVNASYYLSLLITQVSSYHLVYMLTGTGSENRFRPIHYIIPCALVAVYIVWSFFVPFDVRLLLVTSRGDSITSGYEAYALFSTNRIKLRGIYSIVYIMLGIRRYINYKKHITDFSADGGRSSLGWLYMLIVLSVVILPIPLLSLFFSHRQMMTPFLILPHTLILLVQHSILCYNMLVGNYVIITKEKPSKHTSKYLTKGIFDLFMNKEKPYLNPELKITDLTYSLITNRTYLSEFINREYGVNFSHYINRQRLKELDRLRQNHEYDHLSEVELIEMAGFSSFGAYRWFINAEKRLNKRPFVN